MDGPGEREVTLPICQAWRTGSLNSHRGSVTKDDSHLFLPLVWGAEGRAGELTRGEILVKQAPSNELGRGGGCRQQWVPAQWAMLFEIHLE